MSVGSAVWQANIYGAVQQLFTTDAMRLDALGRNQLVMGDGMRDRQGGYFRGIAALLQGSIA